MGIFKLMRENVVNLTGQSDRSHFCIFKLMRENVVNLTGQSDRFLFCPASSIRSENQKLVLHLISALHSALDPLPLCRGTGHTQFLSFSFSFSYFFALMLIFV